MQTQSSKYMRGARTVQSATAAEGQRSRFESVKTFAQLLNISEATVWRRIADGTIVSMKFGGTRRIDVAASLARLTGER